MDTKIILIYCVCSDFLKNMEHPQNDSWHMSDAEVLTLAIVAAMFFCGSHEKARIFLFEYNYIPNMLSKSHLNRRLHAFDESFGQYLLYQLSRSLLHKALR